MLFIELKFHMFSKLQSLVLGGILGKILIVTNLAGSRIIENDKIDTYFV